MPGEAGGAPGFETPCSDVTLETPRSILRCWREEDAAPLAAVNADPEVMRWIGDGNVRDEQQTRSGIEAMEREWEAQGFGLFDVEIGSTGELAGFTGLSTRLHARGAAGG
ncbi:GNAT family N-acetyltransferase [Streptomyces sp. NPDC002889]|uniref:GNAT family N-acetyltransferase n=1 Tax=Streptomyces sp. NPDC002889 TaxID=3364669 RepID=UPI003686732B